MSERRAEPPIYVDSSVLVALLASGDSHHRSALQFAHGHPGPIVSSSISEVEVGRALARREAPRSITQVARELLDRCEFVEVTGEVRQRAVEVRPASARSLDTIHVATALVAGVDQFATYDARQRVAAEEMGLKLQLR